MTNKNLTNKIKKLAMIPILAGSLSGCDYLAYNIYVAHSKTELSDILHEKGEVINTFHSEKRTVKPTGFYGHQRYIRITIPEKWGIVFKCEHGTRTITDRDFEFVGEDFYEKYKKFQEGLHKGDSIKVSYRDCYKLEYNGNTEKLLSKKFFWTFLTDAEKIGEKIK